MRIVVHGQQAFGKAVLEALLKRNENVVAVYVAPEKPGQKADPLKEAALAAKLPITIDLAGIQAMDTRFLGQLLMLRKLLTRQGLRLKLTGARLSTRLLLHLNGFGFLLAPDFPGE